MYNVCSKFAQLGIGSRKPAPYATSPSRTPSQGSGFDVEHFVRGLFHNVDNRRALSAVDRAYAATVRWNGASDRVGTGRQDATAMARALLVTFPDFELQVDEVHWMGNEHEGFRVSVRWTALGTHRGNGLYGTPTSRRTHLWGINQLYLRGGRITEDWMMFNEFDVMAQILPDEPDPTVCM